MRPALPHHVSPESRAGPVSDAATERHQPPALHRPTSWQKAHRRSAVNGCWWAFHSPSAWFVYATAFFFPPNEHPSETRTFHYHTAWSPYSPLHWAHSRSSLSFRVSSCCSILSAYWFKQLSISKPRCILGTHFLQKNPKLFDNVLVLIFKIHGSLGSPYILSSFWHPNTSPILKAAFIPSGQNEKPLWNPLDPYSLPSHSQERIVVWLHQHVKWEVNISVPWWNTHSKHPERKMQQERIFSPGIWERSNRTSHLTLISYLKPTSFDLYPHIAFKAAFSSFTKRLRQLSEIFQQMNLIWFRSSIELLPWTRTQSFSNISTRVKLSKFSVSHNPFTLLGEDESSTLGIISLSPPALLWV